MPNWCSGSITSDSPELADRIRQIEADGGRNVMGRFHPMPEPLHGVHTGGRRIGDEYVTKWRGDGDDAVAVTDDESTALIDKYGADNWYDWNVANWGCKWDFDVTHAEYVDGGVRVTYDTPWAPPTPFVERLSELYPEHPITMAYAESGMGYAGRQTFLNGMLVDEWNYEGSLYREDLTEDDWNGDPDDLLKPEVADFLTRHDLGTGG